MAQTQHTEDGLTKAIRARVSEIMEEASKAELAIALAKIETVKSEFKRDVASRVKNDILRITMSIPTNSICPTTSPSKK